MQRLKQQLASTVQWVRQQAKNNPLGSLVVIVLSIWFLVTLWITARADRLGSSGKTFWDWLELLVVPLVLAIGAFWFNASQKKTELDVAAKARETDRAIARARRQEATLETYYDRMADLLLNHGLRETTDKDEARSIARARTLSVLRTLSAERKKLVLLFLHESGLIDRDKPVVDLREADLSEMSFLFDRNRLSRVNLSGANLTFANLSGSDLRLANLSRAFLGRTNLSEAKLMGADLSNAGLLNANLSRAYLGRASLSGALLNWADLSGADLDGADLSGADLSEANLNEIRNWTAEQLRKAKSLERATMPDGTKYEEWIEKQKGQ